MVEILGALLAGVLTTLAPCVLPLLPVVVGGSVVGVPGATGPSRDVRRALVITAGLVGSVLAFTLLLRASTVLLGVDPAVWRWVSGGLLVVLGLVMALPSVWDRVTVRLGLQARAQQRLASASSVGAAGVVAPSIMTSPRSIIGTCSLDAPRRSQVRRASIRPRP